jgi:hypothetical protein
MWLSHGFSLAWAALRAGKRKRPAVTRIILRPASGRLGFMEWQDPSEEGVAQVGNVLL